MLPAVAINRQSTCSVLATELAAIGEALQLGMRCYIFSDSTKALSAIRSGNRVTSYHAILRDISILICQKTRDNWPLRIPWSPRHRGIHGIEEANTAARQATATQSKPTAPVEKRIRELKGVLQLIEEDRRDNSTPSKSYRTVGQYTWPLDQALPGKHTLALYNISSEEASVLIQARTKFYRLNKSLYRLKIVYTADC
jgi:hypothetical protein